MRNSHNPNRQEGRNSALDRGFDPRTWRHSVHPQRLAGTACAPVHAAMAPVALTPNHEQPTALLPQVASQLGHLLRLQRVREMSAQMHTT